MTKYLLALSLIVVFAAGCNRGEGGSSSASSGGSGAKLKVVYIPKQTGNTYFNEVDRGFQEASKQLGFDYTTTGPATSDATSQIPIIKDQIQRSVDVIALSPNSPDALNQVLDEAKKQGITIITVDADLDGNESHRDAGVLPTDSDKVGPAEVELLGSQIGYAGDIAILSARTDAPNQNAWIAGMKDALKLPKYANMHLIDTVFGDDDSQKSTTECEALLTKHPSLKGIISPTSVGLAACAQVFERRFGAKPGAIKLTGLSTPNQLKKFVKEGVVTSFQLWAPYNEGFMAAVIGTQIHQGKLKPAEGVSVDVPKLGKQTFSKKLQLFGGPLLTFDKNNIDSYSF